MSNSSNLSGENERIAARLRLICPQGGWKIFMGNAVATDGLDAFCVISESRPPEISRFVLCSQKQHRVPEKLGDVVARFLRKRGLPAWLGALCRPESMVGSRICQTPVTGVSEYFYRRHGLSASTTSSTECVRDLVCSVIGLGHLPLVGATAASFVTCALAFALSAVIPSDPWRFTMLFLAIAASIACVLLEKWAHRHYLAEDPREVVLDEVAGMALALAIIGPGAATITAAFFAFRFFDIFKPGIHWIERRGWPGTILWDDLLAGLYAGGIVVLGARIGGRIISFNFS